MGMLYYDLKASHVFLSSNLRVELIDLGLCDEIGEDRETSKPGGTLHAMSPEMARLYLKRAQEVEIDYKTDLVTFSSDYYSLGILAIELLTGAAPNGYCKNGSTLAEKTEYLEHIIDKGVTEDHLSKLSGVASD
jgi:serine/threonine protein kinase